MLLLCNAVTVPLQKCSYCLLTGFNGALFTFNMLILELKRNMLAALAAAFSTS